MSERILYSHTACAKALRSTHPDEAVFSFAPIVPDVLYSVASESHTAFASHSGDNGVNGDISPVIYPRAVISASAVMVTIDSQVENAIAQRVPVPVNVAVAFPAPYRAAAISPHIDKVIVQSPVADDIRDSSADHESTIVVSQSPLIPITAVPDCPSCISEKPTTYPATLGNIHQFCQYPVGSHHNFGEELLV